MDTAFLIWPSPFRSCGALDRRTVRLASGVKKLLFQHAARLNEQAAIDVSCDTFGSPDMCVSQPAICPVTIAAAARRLSASRTDGKPACKASGARPIPPGLIGLAAGSVAPITLDFTADG